jgi:hypothetical protein
VIEDAKWLDKRWAAANVPDPPPGGGEPIIQNEIDDTRAALSHIGKNAPQYAEAQRLLNSLWRREAGSTSLAVVWSKPQTATLPTRTKRSSRAGQLTAGWLPAVSPVSVRTNVFLLEPNEITRELRRKRVTVVDYPDGRLAIRYRGLDLP